MSSYAQQQPSLLIADQLILSIPIIENNEPMVDIAKYHDISYGPSPETPDNTSYTKMRKTVYLKLKRAQSLLPKGMRFCLYESYRSTDLQKRLFDSRWETIKSKHPDWPPEKLFHETTRMVSPVINLNGSENIPPHSTGAAIDVYLIDKKGNTLDMGIHPKDWMSDVDGSLSLTASPIISEEARTHRRIMSNALEAVGFVNYSTEYWHWSYGDRYWAYYKHRPYALYNRYE